MLSTNYSNTSIIFVTIVGGRRLYTRRRWKATGRAPTRSSPTNQATSDKSDPFGYPDDESEGGNLLNKSITQHFLSLYKNAVVTLYLTVMIHHTVVSAKTFSFFRTLCLTLIT